MYAEMITALTPCSLGGEQGTKQANAHEGWERKGAEERRGREDSWDGGYLGDSALSGQAIQKMRATQGDEAHYIGTKHTALLNAGDVPVQDGGSAYRSHTPARLHQLCARECRRPVCRQLAHLGEPVHPFHGLQ